MVQYIGWVGHKKERVLWAKPGLLRKYRKYTAYLDPCQSIPIDPGHGLQDPGPGLQAVLAVLRSLFIAK